MRTGKRILVCPLDWGLGHATRCVPIIRELLQRDCQVVIASSGSALSLLQLEFPNLETETLPAYDPVYAGSSSQLLKMFIQVPHFVRTISAEHAAIDDIITRHQTDIIISDNRYGCYSGKVTSIFITHQLNIRVPALLSWINLLNRRQVRKFDACWIPDIPGDGSLGGELSLARTLRVTYIGALSRLSSAEAAIDSVYDVAAIVSGPEPQRAFFETMMKESFARSTARTLLIKGVPRGASGLLDDKLKEIDHLSSTEMGKAIVAAKIIISRPGYSTIMDLATLGKKAIFVPTPGQTEQEYLGERLMKKNIALCVRQDQFDLEEALSGATGFGGFKKMDSNYLLSDALNDLLK